MKDVAINTYLEDLKKNVKYDVEFIELLENSLTSEEEGEKIAQKIITVINNRYAKNKENKT